jgi:hypothetical protein
MWQCQSSPQQGGEAQGHGTHGSAGAHLGKEARSGAAGHVTASEPTSARRQGPELQGMSQHMDAHRAPCLDLNPVCGSTRSTGY